MSVATPLPANINRSASVLLAGVMVLFFAPIPVQAAEPTSPEDVYEALGIDEVSAEYVFLLDVSGSMSGQRYADVKSALRTFLASVAPHDHVSLVTFAEQAHVVAQGEAGRSPGTLVDQLPADATGGWTDIGRALEAAVGILARDGAAPIGTVVLLTDGAHEPPKGSPYPYESGYAWDELRNAADSLPQEVLTAYAIPLRGVTGAHLLARVFADASVLEAASIDDVTQLLQRPKHAVQAAKARSVLATDLAAGVAVEWPDVTLDAGVNEVAVVLRADTAHIPVEVTDLTIRSSVEAVSATVESGPVAIEPGGRTPITVHIVWQVGPRTWKPTSTVTVEVALSLAGTVTSPWSQALAGDGIQFAPELSGATTTLPGSVENGRPGIWLSALAALFALVAAVLLFRYRRLHPSLVGSLSVEPPTPRSPMPLRGPKATISSATLGVPGFGTARLVRPRVNAPAVLEVAYSRDGQAHNRELKHIEEGESVDISGIRFTWRSQR